MYVSVSACVSKYLFVYSKSHRNKRCSKTYHELRTICNKISCITSLFVKCATKKFKSCEYVCSCMCNCMRTQGPMYLIKYMREYVYEQPVCMYVFIVYSYI